MPTNSSHPVLLVDDDMDIQEFFSKAARELGVELVCRGTAEDAMEWLACNAARLVFLDYRLPGMSGTEFIQHLQKVAGSAPPFIIMTGVGDQRTAVESMRLGAMDYLVKDVEFLFRAPAILRSSLTQADAVLEMRAVKHSLAIFSEVFSLAAEGIIITGADGNILAVNEAFTRITGYDSADVIGRNPRLLQSGKQDAEFYRRMWESINLAGSWEGEVWNKRKNGEIYPEWLSIRKVVVKESGVVHFVGIFSDIGEQKSISERLDHMNHYDPLTDLPNRALVLDRLEQAISSSQRDGQSVAVFLLSFDRLNLINDTLGMSAGDQIIVEVTRRLMEEVRAGDTVGRMASNEFALIISGVEDVDQLIALARRLLKQVAAPMTLFDHEVNISASLGGCLYPQDGDNPGALLSASGMALSHARNEGGGAFQFFQAGMNTRAVRWVSLEGHLRHALDRNEFVLHYQPQVNLTTGNVVGVEALIRWKCPDLVFVSPVDFIPLAEDTGLIVPIGAWVIKEACRQNKAWQDQGLPPIRMAVNIASRQFREGDLPGLIAEALAESGMLPQYLEAEVTESAMLRDPDATHAQIDWVSGLGVRWALDDFGTGYSSLGYLQRFNLDVLKVDQSFVRDITTNPKNAGIAKAAIAMAHSLGMHVIAEGVETEGQLNYLRKIGCDEMQGYLFSKPLPPEELVALLAANKTLRDVVTTVEKERTLLCVDDEENILSAMRRVFRREGYRVLLASSGRQGLELLANHDVQVIISDQRMPDMSGSEFLSRVKEMYPDTVRIVLTGYADMESVAAAINKGAIFKFLAKPWDDEELREQIRDAFNIQERLRDTSDL